MTAPSETTGYEIAQRCAVAVAALVPMSFDVVVMSVWTSNPSFMSGPFGPFFVLGVCVILRLAVAVASKDKKFPWDFYIAFSILSFFWIPHVALPLARFIYALLGEPL